MGAVTVKAEIEWVPGSGTWTDLSSRLEYHKITRPRSASGEGAATTFELRFQNDPVRSTEVGGPAGFTSAQVGICPLSPESPLSPWYPNLTRDRRVRLTAFWAGGASSAVRILGWTDSWAGDVGDNPPATATVTVTGSDILSRYARHKTLSLYGDIVVINHGSDTDYYPFDDDPDSAVLRGVSENLTITDRPGKVIQPKRIPGSATLGAPDGGHLTDGQISFSRGDDNAPSPVVLIPTRPGAQFYSFAAWYRLGNDPAGALGDDVVSGYDADGQRLWVWGPRLISGAVQWTLYDNAGVQKTWLNTGAPRDGGWHYWYVKFDSSTQSSASTADKGQLQLRTFGSGAWTYDPRAVAYLVIGGQMRPRNLGSQSNTYQGDISSLVLQYGGAGFQYLSFGNPGLITTADAISGFLDITAASTDSLVGGAFSSTTDITPYTITNTPRNLLDRWNEHVRTVSGALITRPDGKRWYLRSADVRPITVAITLDAEQHLSAPDGGWSPVKEERPTRVTVSSPLGSFEVVDTVTEAATGLRLDGPSVDSAAGGDGVARSIAGRILSAGGTRLGSFGVDLTTTSTDITTTMMALYQTQRIRVSNLPSALTGVTQLDVYASGWTETYDADSGAYAFQFDTDPADDPSEIRFDNATYARFGLPAGSTITGGTCVGTTGTGTVIITTTSPLTTTGGQYSMDLDWQGERITISGVGGGTSPQTCTVTARGVAPSVARIHATGETVDVWTSARFGA